MPMKYELVYRAIIQYIKPEGVDYMPLAEDSNHRHVDPGRGEAC